MFARWLRRKSVPEAMLPASSQVDLEVASQRDVSRALAFMHIPRTSGMALMSGLAAALEPSAVVMGFDRCLFGAFNSFDTLDVNEQQRIYQLPSLLPAGTE